MGSRVRALAVVGVILVAGAFIGSAWSQWWGDGSGSGAPAHKRSGARVRVEVLNAGGSSGVARSATESLRDSGFDVVFFGNAATFDRDSSVVLDRMGHLDAARAVADVLGIHNVRSQPDSNLYLDVSVLLGRDWVPAAPGATPPAAPKRAWWDPRGWFKR